MPSARVSIDDGLLGAGHLHHAEQGIVGGLAQELGIDGDDGVFGEAVAGGGEVVGGGNQIHERPMTLLTAVLPKVL